VANLPRAAAATKTTCTWCGADLCGCCAEKWAGHLSDRSCQESRQLAAGDAASEAYIRATSKPCPNCRTPISHFHGDACHHISPSNGCPCCHTHFCSVCSTTADENIRERGDSFKCRCLHSISWSYMCTTTDVSWNQVCNVNVSVDFQI
jgi:hypothetical protein